MKISSIIREKAGLKPLARNRIQIIEGNSPPTLKGNSYSFAKSEYIPSKAYVEVGQDWVLDLSFEVSIVIGGIK